MTGDAWTNFGLLAAAFAMGAVGVKRLEQHFTQRRGAGGHRGSASQSASLAAASIVVRPLTQIPVRSMDELVATTGTADLVRSIDRRTRFSAAMFERDCQPLLQAFAEFVQMLPASECHHHAQPGGLWIHALEVVDAALTFRAGLELPPGANTELRKRLEHRWTFGVMAGALLHDVGKPITAVRVTMFTHADAHAGRPWMPLAGPIRPQGGQFYSVTFAEANERDYKAHGKVGAMLLHQFVRPGVIRWLSEEGDVLAQLLAYLAGEDQTGPLADIIKRADADSVRRNLLHGPRTRFSSARTRPLIERLMEALRRMLHDGGVLPLNRPGAAGWVYDGCMWLVCARLAEEVRSYLSQHESLQGVPGKDRNDRLFDIWQESGAVRPNPEGGAIWRVRVECDAWRSPDPLTVLCFPLDRLFETSATYPASINGRILPEPAVTGLPATPAAAAATNAVPLTQAMPFQPTAASSPVVPVNAPSAGPPQGQSQQAPVPAASVKTEPALAPLKPVKPAVPASTASKPANKAPSPTAPSPTAPSPAPAPAAAPETIRHAAAEPPVTVASSVEIPPWEAAAQPGTASAATVAQAAVQPAPVRPVPEAAVQTPAAVVVSAPVAAPVAVQEDAPWRPQAPRTWGDDDEVLPASESARMTEPANVLPPLPATAQVPTTVGAPTRPHAPGGQAKPKKAPTPAAEAFMAWVAAAVGSGELKYNEDGALVHFVPQGCLLLSPEVFKRFVDLYRELPEGPVAELVAAHGDRSFARLQNELAKSGWTRRNGDENLHYFAFTKADSSLSRVASFYLVPQPELFWNPVPKPNERIKPAPRPKKLVAPKEVP